MRNREEVIQSVAEGVLESNLGAKDKFTTGAVLILAGVLICRQSASGQSLLAADLLFDLRHNIKEMERAFGSA